MTATTYRPLNPDAARPPADLLLPGLAHRRAERSPLGQPAHVGGAAAVALSAHLDAVITRGGVELTREDIGRTGISLRRAWDEAAGNLIALATRNGAIPVALAPAAAWESSGWFELSVTGTRATSWLAHPRTFTVVDEFLATRLGERPHYLLLDPAAATVLVTGGPTAPLNGGGDDVVVYQAGFPVPARLSTGPGVAGATFLLAS